jgi:hypothetical protein
VLDPPAPSAPRLRTGPASRAGLTRLCSAAALRELGLRRPRTWTAAIRPGGARPSGSRRERS